MTTFRNALSLTILGQLNSSSGVLASVIVRSCGANKGLPNSPEDFRDDEIIRIVDFKRPMI
jgi:hypothetical protein